VITKTTKGFSSTKLTKCALVFLLALPLHAATPDDPGSRVARVEGWLNAVLEHVPGGPDATVVGIAGWSTDDLNVFRIDLRVFVQLTRDPRLSSFKIPAKELDCVDCFAARRDTTQARRLVPEQRIRYTDEQLHRLKVLACAAAGTIDGDDCKQLKADREIGGNLRVLAGLAAAARRDGDANYTLRRAALLHTDVAIVTAGSLRPVEISATDPTPSVRVHMVDGQAAGVGIGEVHWAIGRDLIDAIRPRPDAMARLWYVATSAWMQRDQQYDPGHLQRARELFPDDASIAFLSGTHAETFASPAIQSALKTAVLPTGLTLRMGNESSELKTAEAMLQRAVQIDPSFPEAHVHLAHVLLARGKPQAAVAELTAVETPDPLLRYYADMFLGAAEEALLHPDAARAAYERAAALFPRAQSPLLALSALYARRSDRGGATKAIGSVFDLPQDAQSRDDPWWRYTTVQGRDAGELLDRLRAPFLHAAER
jgi:tetratricopeptide (TPR) repeat protein